MAGLVNSPESVNSERYTMKMNVNPGTPVFSKRDFGMPTSDNQVRTANGRQGVK
jgi:hypothetical protein